MADPAQALSGRPGAGDRVHQLLPARDRGILRQQHGHDPGRLGSTARQAIAHYVRISNPINPEALTTYPQRPLDQPRQSLPGARRLQPTCSSGLPVFGSYLCTSHPLPGHRPVALRQHNYGRRHRVNAGAAGAEVLLHVQPRRPGLQGAGPARCSDHRPRRQLPALAGTSLSQAASAVRLGSHVQQPHPMKRRENCAEAVLAVTALIVIGAAATAYAASVNSYKINFGLHAEEGGHRQEAASRSATRRTSRSTPGTPGNRTADPARHQDDDLRHQGRSAKHFPTCSLAKIEAAEGRQQVPQEGGGRDGLHQRHARRSEEFSQSSGSACATGARRVERRQGEAVVLLRDHPDSITCLDGGLKTGGTPPYPGTYKQQGKNLVVDVPIPDVRSTTRSARPAASWARSRSST